MGSRPRGATTTHRRELNRRGAEGERRASARQKKASWGRAFFCGGEVTQRAATEGAPSVLSVTGKKPTDTTTIALVAKF